MSTGWDLLGFLGSKEHTPLRLLSTFPQTKNTLLGALGSGRKQCFSLVIMSPGSNLSQHCFLLANTAQ